MALIGLKTCSHCKHSFFPKELSSENIKCPNCGYILDCENDLFGSDAIGSSPSNKSENTKFKGADRSANRYQILPVGEQEDI